jgi:hypothetical protein
MSRHTWSTAQTEVLIETYPHIPTAWLAAVFGLSINQVHTKAGQLGLHKSAIYLASEFAGRLIGSRKKGESTRFQPGQQPWNKGTHYQAGGRSAETRFKPGHRSGRAAENFKPLGFERLSKEGYLERKINEDMPFKRRWRFVHLILWESVHGPVPPGHAVAFRDGNKQHIALDNLELITRAELMRRNTCHNYPKEIARVIQLRGAITRQINKRQRSAA